jgi:hypothetical protein
MDDRSGCEVSASMSRAIFSARLDISFEGILLKFVPIPRGRTYFSVGNRSI